MALFFPLAKTLLLMMCVIQGNVMVSIIPDYVNQRLESRKNKLSASITGSQTN